MHAHYRGFPEYDPDDDVIFTFIESQHQLFRIILQDDLAYPSLLDLPTLPDGYRLEEVQVSTEMNQVLRESTYMTSGSDAMIRTLDSDPHIVIKCAYPFPRARDRVAYEYQMLAEIEQLSMSLPVVRTRGAALVDSQGVFAFRLEKLQEWDDAADFSKAIRQVTRTLHKRGICHNDLRGPNLMRNGRSPILIDFERAGLIGNTVPSSLRLQLSKKRFSVKEDIAAMRNLGGLTVFEVAVSRVYELVWNVRRFWSSRWPSTTKLSVPTQT